MEMTALCVIWLSSHQAVNQLVWLLYFQFCYYISICIYCSKKPHDQKSAALLGHLAEILGKRRMRKPALYASF